MAQRRFHYDHAFEQYLRDNSVPYVAVDEAKRALARNDQRAPTSLKSFDFVVYSQQGLNLLVDVKGRKHSERSKSTLQNWVTEQDIESLTRWEEIFGFGFKGAFVFLYWCEAEMPDALFQESFECGGKWYSVLTITLEQYKHHMKPRSAKWETVSMPAKAFRQLAQPLRDFL